MIRIEPYKIWSGGAKRLGMRAGILRATKKQVAKYGSFKTIVNWGNSRRRFDDADYINSPEAVARASNKLETSRIFGEADCGIYPRWWSSRDDAIAAFDEQKVKSICCRTALRASSGRGLIIANSAEEVVNAPLYVEYIKKTDEYRVHVFDGEVIDVQQKRKRQEVPNEEVNYQVRNSDNGWVYCRNGVSPPESVVDAAITAVRILGLDFGAVDIGHNLKQARSVVYEVNTAPGLEGTTVDLYYEALRNRLPALRGGAYARRRRVVFEQRVRNGY